MQRTLHPELLDSLPADHPDALHNRRDLRLVNAITGSHRWFAHRLSRLARPGETALELGAGTGELGRRLASAGVAVDGLDLWPRPREWPPAQAWHVSDLRSFEGYPRYPAIIGNLIFHQFSDDELAALGKKISAHTRVILANEPARRRASQILYRVFAILSGANHVSRHDAHVSIGAGFRGHELPRAFGLDARTWDVRCHTTVFGMYRLIAVRHPSR